MNPLYLLPLLVAGCVAAPSVALLHAGVAPVATVTHEVTAHVPSGVEYKALGEAVALAPAVAPVAAVPGYSVDGEIRQITQEFPEPAPVAVDANALPVLQHAAPIAYSTVQHGPAEITGAVAGAVSGAYHGAVAPVAYTGAVAPVAYTGAVAAAHLPLVPEVKTVEAPAVVAAPVAVAPALAPVAYSNVNLNIPAPVPAGEAPAPEELVQRIPVKALGRPVITHTPVITEVRPELKITERVYDVAVPKPVYETKEVTPVQHKFVPEPYAVPQPYPVPQPYAVPQPVAVPVPVAKPVHVHHNVVAAPTAAVTYGAHQLGYAGNLGYTGAIAAPAGGLAYGAHHLGYTGAHLGYGYGNLGYNLGYGAQVAVVADEE